MPRIERLEFRRFGTVLQDLDADFAAERPFIITDLLRRCATSTVTEDEVWDLTVGRRIADLLALASRSGAREFDVIVPCPHCGQKSEVTLELEELLALTESAITGSGFRLPTGRDQREWLRFAAEHGNIPVDRMLGSLRTSESVAVAEIESLLDQADPLVRGAVTAVCPNCGQSTEVEADLAGKALARLEDEQNRLLESVHLLALRYHWSESEIFALPVWRRERYLELLRSENYRWDTSRA
jgi:predicted RNA-binding Zn-ribbon protein involved in translation (DUF1610 family)